MKLAVSNPNLSVVMPVGCNAKCPFCYWEKREGLTLKRFEFIGSTLPSLFSQVSITGGEPTLSPHLQGYLRVASERFDKVVLNTNGCMLKREHFKYVDHVNISRHHYLEEENRKVFGTKSVPSAAKLSELCGYGDVTINCVIPDGFSDDKFIAKYIEFGRTIGANVAFRKYFNNLEILPVDKEDTLVDEHQCPSCRHRVHSIDGVKVTFKYSVKETFEDMGGIYELIVQSNGDLTYDWDGKRRLEYVAD